MSLRKTFSAIAIVVFSGLTVASAGFAQDASRPSSARQGPDMMGGTNPAPQSQGMVGGTNSTPQGHGMMGMMESTANTAEMMNMMRQMTRMMENCNRMMESADQNPAIPKKPSAAQTPPG
jgi:hypothetical protein